MPAITVRPHLYEQLRQVAQWEARDTDTLVENALQDYLDRLEWQKLREELEAFAAMQQDLQARYPDQYVAIHQGQVVDHDRDLRNLYLRVYERWGHIPVLLKKVSSEPGRESLIRTPRIER